MKQQAYPTCNLNILHDRMKKTVLLGDHIKAQMGKGTEDAFFLGDFNDIIQKVTTWNQEFPRVQPFYAVKCNDHPAVLKLMADLGLSFDCASKAEIGHILNLGVPSSRIIFANPCKQTSFVRYAAKHHVSLMTFDNESELYKVQANYPDARLVLRILPPADFKVQCELGMKFGCPPKRAHHLLEVAAGLDLKVIGISFHVGSGCEDAQAFSAAIKQAHTIFSTALELGFDMQILDIGGGFPGHESSALAFSQMAVTVNKALDQYFPADSGVKIIAEPGRYFVASAFTLVVNVIAKRIVARDALNVMDDGTNDLDPTANDEPAFMYYVNDGIYGSFNCLFFDHATVHAKVIKQDGEIQDADLAQFTSSIWGPTCDGLDRIEENCRLPELHVGDWLYFEDMGAYTMCAASAFNGMPKPKYSFIVDSEVWRSVFPDSVIKTSGMLPNAAASIKSVKNIANVPAACVGESAKPKLITSDYQNRFF